MQMLYLVTEEQQHGDQHQQKMHQEKKGYLRYGLHRVKNQTCNMQGLYASN